MKPIAISGYPIKAKKKIGGVNRKRNITLLCMALPMLVYTFIFKYLPMGGIVIAFKSYKYNLGILRSPWAGLKNFSFFLTSPDAWRITRNTLGYNLIFLIIGVVVPVVMALLLSEVLSKKTLKAYQTAMFIPHFLSWVVVAFIVYAFLNSQSGLVNQVFKRFGVAPVDWYVKSKPWVGIVIISNTWKTMGMSTLMYYAALMGVDKEYYEAATVEGASKWQLTISITLPFLYPLMTMLTLLGVGSIFTADFGLFYQLPMNSALLYPTTDVLDTYVFRALKENSNIGMSAAADFFKSIMGFVCVLLSNIVVRRIDPEMSLF
ncbi:sugar ABC transporter permease [Clostridia bacterium]|nr:sugar ABC transporter permease [Clostridia bacterium]